MSSNIKQATITGLIWNAVDRFGQQFLYVITGIIMARILSPENFGIIGLLTIFSTIGTSLADSGFGTALLREKQVEEIDYSSMFVFNLSISLFIYCILFFSAPYIADFFNIPSLKIYARVIFIAIPIYALGIVQYIKLLRAHNFKLSAKINVTALFLSSICAVGIAVLQFGEWALVFQVVLYPTFRSFLLWTFGNWTLSFVFAYDSFAKYIKFSVNFVVANLLNKLFPQMYFAFLGKIYPINQVGYYVQANKYADIIGLLINSVLQGVALTTLSKIQDEKARFINACRKLTRLLSFLLFPFAVGAICVAKPAVLLILTEKWSPSIPLFQLLCIAGVIVTLSDTNVNFLNIKGKSHLSLRLEFFKVVLAFVVLLLTYPLGLVNIVLGQIAVRLFCYLLLMIVVNKQVGYNFLEQIKDLLPYAVLSILMGMIMLVPKLFLENNLALLITQCLVGFVFYIGSAKVLKSKVLDELIEVTKTKFFPGK